VARGESLAAACAGAGGCGIRCAEALARFRERALCCLTRTRERSTRCRPCVVAVTLARRAYGGDETRR